MGLTLTLNEVLSHYPVKVSLLAIDLRRSRVWVNRLAYSPVTTAAVHEANILIVQNYLRKIGGELSVINLSCDNNEPDALHIVDFFNKYPFTVAGVAQHLNLSREWLSSIVQNRYRASQAARLKQVLKLQKFFRSIGNDFKEITLIP